MTGMIRLSTIGHSLSGISSGRLPEASEAASCSYCDDRFCVERPFHATFVSAADLPFLALVYSAHITLRLEGSPICDHLFATTTRRNQWIRATITRQTSRLVRAPNRR